MQLLIPGIVLFTSLILLFAFINLRLSIALYIAYLILVPFLQIDFWGISLSYNLVHFVLLISFLFEWKRKKRKVDFKILLPFLFLFSLFSIFILFQWDTPLEFQLNNLRINVIKTCIISLLIWNVSLSDPISVQYLKWSLFISISISCVYGLFLMNLGGINPYTTFLSSHFSPNADVASVYSEMESRLSFSTAGKIQSTMIHPMTWALNLIFLIIIFIVFAAKESVKWYWALIALMIFNLLISGVRTGIVSLIIGFLYYLFRIRDFKSILISVFFLMIAYTIVIWNSDMNEIYTSFADVKGSKSKLGGSSISMRIEQFEGVLTEIKGREMFGKGYGWTSYYQAKNGDHPVILAFESLIFVILCNNGFIGLFIWIIFFLLLFKLNRKIIKLKNDIIFLDILVLVYLIYAIGTGEYAYLPIFSMYYSFLFAYLFYHQSLQTGKKSIIKSIQ